MNQTGKNQVALITGATKGIGKAIALELAQRDYHLFLVGRNAVSLNEIQQSLHLQGLPCHTMAMDLTHADAPAKVVAQAIKVYGKLDVLINNAGMANLFKLTDTPVELWDQLFAINARAPFLMCKAAIPYLEKSTQAFIVNMGSVVGFKGYAQQGAYAASKHALAGFTKVLAKEVQEKGIQVHLISPGGVHTEMVREMRPDIDPEQLIQPEEIAELIAFILTRKGKGTIDHFYIRRQSGLAFE